MVTGHDAEGDTVGCLVIIHTEKTGIIKSTFKVKQSKIVILIGKSREIITFNEFLSQITPSELLVCMSHFDIISCGLLK